MPVSKRDMSLNQGQRHDERSTNTAIEEFKQGANSI